MEDTQCLCSRFLAAAPKTTKKLSTGKYINKQCDVHAREHYSAEGVYSRSVSTDVDGSLRHVVEW